MYSIFTYIWAICWVNVGKYSIRGAYGYGYASKWEFQYSFNDKPPGLEIMLPFFSLVQPVALPTWLWNERRVEHGGTQVRDDGSLGLLGADGSDVWKACCSYRTIICYNNITSGWWFQTCFIFHNIWDNPSHWLVFFRGVESTNQNIYIYVMI